MCVLLIGLTMFLLGNQNHITPYVYCICFLSATVGQRVHRYLRVAKSWWWCERMNKKKKNQMCTLHIPMTLGTILHSDAIYMTLMHAIPDRFEIQHLILQSNEQQNINKSKPNVVNYRKLNREEKKKNISHQQFHLSP